MVLREEVSFVNDPVHVRDLIELTEQKIMEAHVPRDVVDDVSVALLEAVNNAIIHGNQRDQEKIVTVTMTVEDRKVELTVQDQGNGFDPSVLEDPCRPENLFRSNGRGLYFIQKLMDEVEIRTSERGSQIVMRKYWLQQ